jgi:hypothetical protein
VELSFYLHFIERKYTHVAPSFMFFEYVSCNIMYTKLSAFADGSCLILIGPYPVLKRFFLFVLSIKYISIIRIFLTVYSHEQLKFLHFIYVTNYGLTMAYVKPKLVA